jgi:acetyl-CoA synthetase
MVDQRIHELLTRYGAGDACAAELLCDRHPADTVAYSLIAADLSKRDITYRALKLESETFAAALSARGIGAGDRVATLMGKSREYLVTLMGLWRLGAVHVPLFTAFAPPAIALRLTGSRAKAIVCDASQLGKVAGQPGQPPLVITTGEAQDGIASFAGLMAQAQPGIAAAAMGGDAPIIHVFTSGTTGNPKGVIVPLRALASFQAYAEFGFDLRPDDIFWCAADPGWAYGLYFGILATFLTGTPSILLEGGFTPESTFDLLAQQRVTNFAAAPTVYRALRASGLSPTAPLSLRCASSAGEPLTPEVNDWAQSALGVTVHDHYGQTEAGMMINNHHHADVRRPVKAGSMGQAMPGWRAVILHSDRDEEVGADQMGRVAFDLRESPLAWFSGYDGDAAKSAEKFAGDGRWYLSGDTGLVDAEGYFHFSARDDDVIIMAGYRIGPFEVESALATHPAVAESAVISVPDAVRGEVIEAYVVLRTEYEPSSQLEAELQLWVKNNFAAHAYPRTVHFAENLPKTPSGKIQRFLLKEQRLTANRPQTKIQ